MHVLTFRRGTTFAETRQHDHPFITTLSLLTTRLEWLFDLFKFVLSFLLIYLGSCSYVAR